MTGSILDTVREQLRREMNEVADVNVTGGCLSAENASMVAVSYAKNVGIIEGLALAERTILDVLEKIEDQEKLDT